MDDCAGEELAEVVEELAHEGLVQPLSTLRVGVEQTVINGLRNYVVKFLKELLLGVF